MTREEQIKELKQLKQDLLLYKEMLGNLSMPQTNTLQKEDEKVKKLVRWKKNPFGN